MPTIPGTALDVTARMNELLDTAMRNEFLYVHTGEPATVIKFNPPHTNSNGEPMPATVDCILGFHRAYRGKDISGNDTISESSDYVIPSRPIIFPGMPSSMAVLPDLLGTSMVGTHGWLAPNSSSYDDFMVKGTPVLPSAKTRHNINHSMFIPGIVPGPDSAAMALEEGVVKLGAVNGGWQLGFELATQSLKLITVGPELTLDATAFVNVGAGAVDFAASGTKQDANTNALLTALNSFVPGAPDGGAALATLLKTVIGTFTPVSATKAKVE